MSLKNPNNQENFLLTNKPIQNTIISHILKENKFI